MAAERWQQNDLYDYDDEYEFADGTYGYSPRCYNSSGAYHYRNLPNVVDDALRREPSLKRDSQIRSLEEDRPSAATVNASLRNHCLVLFVLITVLSMGLALHRGISADRGYQMTELRRQASRMEKENEAIKVEIAHLKSPQRIKEIATAKLGMIVPENAYFSSDKGDSKKSAKPNDLSF